MKAYLVTTGTLFGLFAAMHLWRVVEKWHLLATDLLNLLRSSLFARASRSLTEPKRLPITTSTEHEVLGL